jgi:serine/threonine protein kinase
MNCQSCGFANPPELLYCGKCGTRLAPPSDITASSTKTLVRPQAALARGRVLAGRYEILEEIGSGGMGTVYRVIDRKIGEEMALKLLKP